MVEKNRQAMVDIRNAKEEAAREEVAAWRRKQQKIFDKGSAQWEARLAEMLDPSQDSDSIPGSAALTKAGVRKQQTAAAAKLAEQRAQTPDIFKSDGSNSAQDGASDFAGMEARTKFFDVFKQESKRRQEEGSLHCEVCVVLDVRIAEATAKEDFEAVRRLREENPAWTGVKRATFGKKGATKARWCEDCAGKDHPEAVDMANADELLDALTVDLDSPRRKFLADCESHGLPPLPLLIWEDDEDKRKVRLNKFRLGDKLIGAYAHGLRLLADSGVPIEELHMEACAMYDDGVIAVTGAFVKLPLLTVLDLSKNRIGKRGGEALALGLAAHKCIKEVNVASCRLSDGTAGVLMVALNDHYSLTTLDMSSNAIGSTPAGFQPLVELIEYQGLLTKLNFSWNSINGSAMKALAMSLKTNDTLTELDISWNSIQDEGALALASALRFNNTLTELNIAHNDIKERGGMVLGDTLKENRGLKKIVFDDNPLGPRGGRGILRGLRWMCEYGITRTMLFSNCNFTSEDKSLRLFDPTDPAGIWDCSLDDPYQRTVANELVELAWTQPGENWKDETLEIDGKKEAYELIEPEPGQVLTREDFKLPEEGVLSVTYVPTARVSRRTDVLTASTFFELISLINRSVNDTDRLALTKLAAAEFYFTAEHSATLMTMFPAGGMLRVDVTASLLPRTVDVVNWNREIFNR